MKKTLGSILILSLIISLISCGNTSTTSISSTNNNLISQSNTSPTENSNLDQLTKTYLSPIALSGIGAQNWSNANDIRADSFNAFYVIIAGAPSDQEEVPTVSETEYETLIQKYFNVSTDHLRTSGNYDSATKSYMLDGIGGAGGYRVTKESKSEDILTMNYEYTSAEDDSIIEFSGVLTVKLDNSGGYKYISCEN